MSLLYMQIKKGFLAVQGQASESQYQVPPEARTSLLMPARKDHDVFKPQVYDTFPANINLRSGTTVVDAA